MPALDGMRVLDMTHWEAGASCTQALAWLGADVVKVEPPGSGEPGRMADAEGDSAFFITWNSNKRSIVIDLDNPAGRDLLLEMAPHYDVFVENYGPGVIEKLDIGYDVIRRAHPDIIYARAKGFGTSGPYAGYKCMDMVAQAAGGSLSTTGMPDGPPVCPGLTAGDAGTGVQLALAILAAYIQKQRTGEGQLVELSMQEAVTYYVRTAIAYGSDWGRRAAPRDGSGVGATMKLYPCRPGGPNDYIYLMVVNTRMWQSLCKAIGRSDLLEDPRFARGRDRHEHADALYDEIAKWSRERSKYEAMKIIGEGGVPCSAVLDTADLFRDPHLLARGFVKTIQHPVRGELHLLGWPARLAKSEVPIEPAPLVGENTAGVLREDLGLGDAELGALREAGAIPMT